MFLYIYNELTPLHVYSLINLVKIEYSLSSANEPELKFIVLSYHLNVNWQTGVAVWAVTNCQLSDPADGAI